MMIRNKELGGCMMESGWELFEAALDIVREFLASSQDRESKVVDFKLPDELRSLMDLSLGEEGLSNEEVLELCKKALQFSVHTAHPRMFNTLFTGVDMVGLSGAVMTSAANTSVYTYEMAPVFNVMEKEVLRKMREMVGWASGSGIFSPGGSVSNLYGLMAARYHKFPDSKARGCGHLPQLTIFTSCQSHYSVEKVAILMGLGTDNVVKVGCDKMGRMDTDCLERSISEAKGKGHTPFVVVGTAGTTVLGVFDPLDRISDICQAHNAWFHVDGSYGASCLVSKTYRHLCRGIEKADSVTWNPHKALHVPFQCSAFLTRHESILREMLSLHASYLFQKDKVLYDVSLDTGDMSLQCGRVNDAFKVWLMWKKHGLAWGGREIDRQVGLAAYLRDRIRERTGFQLVVEEQQYSNVCFWYIPPCLRGVGESERKERLHNVAPKLKAAMVLAGTMMICYQPLGDMPNFLRMVTVSTSATEADMDFVLDELERIGTNLQV